MKLKTDFTTEQNEYMKLFVELKPHEIVEQQATANFSDVLETYGKQTNWLARNYIAQC